MPSRIKISSKQPITAVDLFCGAGGFTLAARNIGLHVLAAIENFPHACATYKANFLVQSLTPPKLFSVDITSLSPATFMEKIGLHHGQLDILMGGPPCQGFSTHRIKNAGVNDPRNRLLLQYFKYVEAMAPKAFLVENVPGVLWARHAQYIKEFYALSETAGYDVFEPMLLNAKDYGVPQNRNRVFILGFKGHRPAGLEWPPAPTHFPPLSKKVDGTRLPEWRMAGEVFKEPLSENDPNAIHMNHSPDMVEVFRSTPANGGSRNQSNRILPCHENHNGHTDVYGRINPDMPGPTMTTACINPSKGRFLHPTEHHGITARHAARFQTFPEWFKFKGGLMAAGIQVGNAVPIRLGEAVLRSVVASLKSS